MYVYVCMCVHLYVSLESCMYLFDHPNCYMLSRILKIIWVVSRKLIYGSAVYAQIELGLLT